MSLISNETRFGSLPSYIYGTDAYDSTKLGLGPRIKQFTDSTGINENKWVGPLPLSIGRPVETGAAIPAANVHAIQWSSNVDWIFFADQAAGAATRRVQLYTYNRTTGEFLWRGFVTISFPYGGTQGVYVVRSIKCLYTQYTTGNVAVNGVTMTGSATTWLDDGVCPGSRIGFGGTDPTAITSWYEVAVPYTFQIAVTAAGAPAAFASAGAVYTNNGQFFTVINTISGHPCLVASGTGAPTTVAGTLTKVSGVGDLSIAFTANWGLGFTSYTCSAANATVGAVYTNNVYTYTITAGSATVGDTYYSGTTATNGQYTFTVGAGVFAVAGTTYTNNAVTFTVNQTINGALILTTTAAAAPLAGPNTLTKSGAGAGDATIAYSAVTAPNAIVYTVTSTVVTGLILQTTGTLPPAIPATTLTLTKASGSGSATLTYSSVVSPLCVVNSTIAGATSLITNGTITDAPSGTLTKLYGTGDASITYSASSYSPMLNTLAYITTPITGSGIISNGPYVIEGLRIVLVCTNATTATNSGVFVSKGLRFENFNSGGTAIAASTATSNVVNLYSGVGVDKLPRTNYWLRDATIETNITAIGSDTTPFVSWTDESLYVLDTLANPILYKYNLRAPLSMITNLTVTVTSANATVNAVYANGGQNFTVTATIAAATTLIVSSTTGILATAAGTLTKVSGTGDATIAYSAFTTTDRYSLSALVWKTGAHGALTGTPTQMNNFVMATTSHGTGSGSLCGYFTTSTRFYRTGSLSGNLSGSTTWAGDNFVETPPGSTTTFTATGSLNSLAYSTILDRFVITTGNRAYLTKYQSGADPVWERNFLADNKQTFQISASPEIPIIPTFGVGAPFWVETSNGIMYLVGTGLTNVTNFIYAIPYGADWEYSSITNDVAILPAISTTNASNYSGIYTSHIDLLNGLSTSSRNLGLVTEPIRVSYRTSGISDNSGAWTLVDDSGDLTGIVSTSIQFKVEWRILGTSCIPTRLMALGLLYEDTSTDSHYQPSVGNSSLVSEHFAWRFSRAFGTTVPRLKVVLYDVVTNSVLLTDDTTNHTYGTFESSTNGGTGWSSWTNADKTNETTYIRYTPSSLVGSVRVKATLTQY